MRQENSGMRPPGPQGFESLKTAWRFQRDPLGTLGSLIQDHGDIVAYRFGPFPVVLLNHPEAVHHVLGENHTNYTKRDIPFYKMLRAFLGDGLLTSDGPFWLRQRRLAQPAFQRKKIEAMSPIIVRCTEDMVERWRTLPPNARLDVAQEIMHLTLRIVGLLLFSQDLSQTQNAVGSALDELQKQMGERFSAFLPLPPILPTPRDKRFRQAREDLHSLALEIVRERRRETEPPRDLLTSLLEAQDPDSGEAMSDAQVCDELVTFLLAGHETTSNTLTWAFYLLSLHPDQRRRLEAELDAESPQGQSFCDRVILETLRLYPPAWVYGRQSSQADGFGDIEIGPRQIVIISPFTLHRHPDFGPIPRVSTRSASLKRSLVGRSYPSPPGHVNASATISLCWSPV